MESSAGITPARRELTNTPAGNLMDQLIWHGGGRTEADWEKSERKRALVQRMRRGEPLDMAKEARENGILHRRDWLDLMDRAHAPFAVSFDSLSAEGKAQVWELANPDEKRQLIAYMHAHPSAQKIRPFVGQALGEGLR